ncbi:MAG: hypothetical protein ACRBN8_45895 [Nannocystales bacterium]
MVDRGTLSSLIIDVDADIRATQKRLDKFKASLQRLPDLAFILDARIVLAEEELKRHQERRDQLKAQLDQLGI